jgi:hypothetical protein
MFGLVLITHTTEIQKCRKHLFSRRFRPLRPTGFEPQAANTENSSMKRHSVKSAVGETVGISDLPPDLQRVIDRWDTLPAEIKQAILTLVKHAR